VDQRVLEIQLLQCSQHYHQHLGNPEVLGNPETPEDLQQLNVVRCILYSQLVLYFQDLQLR
jgi:hypothetical protein